MAEFSNSTTPLDGKSAPTTKLDRLIAVHGVAWNRLRKVSELGDPVGLGRKRTTEDERIFNEACDSEAAALKAVMSYPVQSLEEAAVLVAYIIDKIDAALDIADLEPLLDRLASFGRARPIRDQPTRFDCISELECVIATATGLNNAIEELSTLLEGEGNAARKLSAICAVAAAMHDNLVIGEEAVRALYEIEVEKSSTGTIGAIGQSRT